MSGRLGHSENRRLAQGHVLTSSPMNILLWNETYNCLVVVCVCVCVEQMEVKQIYLLLYWPIMRNIIYMDSQV